MFAGEGVLNQARGRSARRRAARMAARRAMHYLIIPGRHFGGAFFVVWPGYHWAGIIAVAAPEDSPARARRPVICCTNWIGAGRYGLAGTPVGAPAACQQLKGN